MVYMVQIFLFCTLHSHLEKFDDRINCSDILLKFMNDISQKNSIFNFYLFPLRDNLIYLIYPLILELGYVVYYSI